MTQEEKQLLLKNLCKIDMFDYLLKKYLLLFDEFNKIGETFKPVKEQMSVGKIHYLDYEASEGIYKN